MIDALADAIYRTVHNGHPRGAVGLGPLIGVRASYLQNKADPSHDAELTLRESIPLMRETGDYAILATLAASVDHAVIPVGDYSKTSDAALLDLYCEYHADLGQTAEAIREALGKADTRITRADVRRVRREMLEDIQAGLAFLARLESLAEDDED